MSWARATVLLGALALTEACAERAVPRPTPIQKKTSSARQEELMPIADKFKALTEEWEAHRQSVLFSSNIQDTLNHPAYRALIELGDPAIPLIIERYRADSLPWGFVLQEITGVRMIDDPGSFRPDEVRRRWIDWWERKLGTQAR